MAILLTYNNDLSRVQIALSGIEDGAVRVEHAAQATGPWTAVRGGTELPIVSGEGEIDDFEFYADVETFYRVLRVDPVPGLIVDGTPNSYATTPDNAALDIAGDLDLAVSATLTDWAGAVEQWLVAKWNTVGSQRSYGLVMEGGFLSIRWSTTGANEALFTSTEQVTPDADGFLAVRAILDTDDGFGNHRATFYTGSSVDGPWTQLGGVGANAGTVTIFNSTAALTVGARNDGDQGNVTGTIDTVKVKDGINGTEVANPDFPSEGTGVGVFTDDAGRVWTVSGTAEVLGELVDSGSITVDLGETWLKSIKYPSLNRPVGSPYYEPIQRASRAGVYNIRSRSLPVAAHDVRSSPWFSMYIATDTLAQARDLDLVLAAGGTFFVHVPLEQENECFTNPVSGMPGGYVEIAISTQRHVVGGTHTMMWILPLRFIEPPAPEVTGTLLTWGSVERLYGSWEALWAANSAWSTLWNQIGDPDDLVVT